MRWRRQAVICSLTALLLGCGEGSAERGRGADAASSGHIPVRIATGERAIVLRAEVAATGPARNRGLMDRDALPPDAGMLFVYPEEQAPEAGFWMYRTRLPLDIAFLDARGRIVAIRHMTPCASAASHECPRYAPGRRYWAALEVNRGFFARNGVTPGDRVVLPEGRSFRSRE